MTTEISPEILIKNLSDQAAQLFRLADASKAVSTYFRPAYEACWKEGHLAGDSEVLSLRPFVIEEEAQERNYKRLAKELLEAAAWIRSESE